MPDEEETGNVMSMLMYVKSTIEYNWEIMLYNEFYSSPSCSLLLDLTFTDYRDSLSISIREKNIINLCFDF